MKNTIPFNSLKVSHKKICDKIIRMSISYVKTEYIETNSFSYVTIQFPKAVSLRKQFSRYRILDHTIFCFDSHLVSNL